MEQSNTLPMHYVCRTALDTKLQTSFGLLLVELGIPTPPISYPNFENIFTTSWLKRVWEKLDIFNFEVVAHSLRSVFPREGDNWLIALDSSQLGTEAMSCGHLTE